MLIHTKPKMKLGPMMRISENAMHNFLHHMNYEAKTLRKLVDKWISDAHQTAERLCPVYFWEYIKVDVSFE